jgi:hypothetical protein
VELGGKSPQLFKKPVDNIDMNISAISSSTNSLLDLAVNTKATKITQDFSVAILKQTLDQQQQIGEALVKMMQSSTANAAPGSLFDIRA